MTRPQIIAHTMTTKPRAFYEAPEAMVLELMFEAAVLSETSGIKGSRSDYGNPNEMEF